MTNRPLYVLFCLLLLISCKWLGKNNQADQNPLSKNKPSNQMPTTALPLMGDYADDWKVVDSLEQSGLFKSALEKVEAIQARAKNDKNSQQLVKALLFRGKYMVQLEEDGLTKAIQTIEDESKTARVIEKAVLQSMLGQLYATYLQNQGWNLQQRTPIPDGEGGDILTWSAKQIEKHALDLYTASISNNIAILRETPINDIRDILTPGENDSVGGKPLRPHLYDLLCQRALEHFANDRSYLTEPAYAFTLNQPEVFAPRTAFVAAKFETLDSTSGKWLAIKTFQNVLSQVERVTKSSNGGEKRSIDTAATIDADLRRLQFAYNNSVLEDKAARYRTALENLLSNFKNTASGGEIAYQLASFLFYLDTDKVANAKTAVALCEEAIRLHADTYGGKYCRQLLTEIRSTIITSNIEQVNLPDKNILVQVGFRNLKKVWVKVVQEDFDMNKWIGLDAEMHYQHLNSLKPVQTRSWDIQDPADYQLHQTEIALNGLPLGHYFVFISDNPEFQEKKGPVNYTEFYVSNLGAVSYIEQGQTNFVLADRNTGAPLSDVKLEFFEYNYNGSRQKLQSVGSASTSRDGVAKSNFSKNASVQVRAILGKDTLWIGQAYNYRYDRSTDRRTQVQFFTDRAMYRPGQMVYFKGLVYKNESVSGDKRKLPQIVPNQSVTVRFYDVNGQVKGEVKLKSNEFGTFNGTFAAPATGLTGDMSIRAEDGAQGQVHFSVEEYKRPRFGVTTLPVEGAFRVNDKITVRGEAKNYAGNVVDGAQVRYRVTRVARFPFWDFYSYWKRPPYYNQSEMEISNGVTTSDKDGKFSVEFTAIPDADIPKKDQPLFDYMVTFDVTDITGETHSNSSTVSAGYIALQVDLALSSEINIDSLRKVELHTTNMAGQKQAAEGTITLQRLVEPKVFYKERLWERPDINTIAKGEFDKMFPDFAWKDEDDPAKWAREEAVRTVKFNTASTETFDLNEGRTQPGWYIVRLNTKDAFGEKIEIERFVRVWDKTTQFEKPSATVEKPTYQPGETARFTFGGKPEGLYFYFAQERDGDIQKPEWISSQLKGLSSVDVKVLESDRGGIISHWFTIKNNRIYGVGQLSVNVPWSNKDLQISYETFRDKLTPGQKEEWRIKISGPKKDKVAAEMVAAMYDASLDQFRVNSWSSIAFPYNYASVGFATNENFSTNGGSVRFDNLPDNVPARSYHSLNWFNFPMWGRPRYAMMERSMAKPMAAPGAPGAQDEILMNIEAGNASKKVADTYSFAGGMAGEEGNAQEAPLTSDTRVKVPTAAPPPQIRRNLNETVFFFPELRTDAEGNVILKFTMNEALTRWKLLTFAHTKDLQQAVSVKEVVTQKELMVIANPPRFLREGDEMEFSAKVSNLSKEQLTGTATLNLLDAATLQPVEREFGLATNNRIARFSVPAGQSASVSWRIKVPESFNGAVTWQIYADSKTFRDGEENTIPVVGNRMLVTETLPISVRGNQTKKFAFENLKNKGESSSLKTHKYTLEFTSNPVWYAVQSLPYLMEYPHECSEQIFSRFYANTLASSVVKKMPQVKRVFDRWKGTDAMKSNLSKNQELKYALLEETPWVLDAQDEEKQKQNIALLFDLNRMANEREKAINTLAERQLGNGGWPWFTGGQDSWYITQHITCGMMHLQKLGAYDPQDDQAASNMVDKALGYCDGKIVEQYRKLAEQVQLGKAKFEDDHLDGMAIQYLYTRSFSPMDKPTKEVGYYLEQAAKYWLGKGIYQEGMLALALHRFGNKEAAGKIVNSLRERATMKEELGMYWPVDWGYYWYQLPVETQALMVEVFGEVASDMKSVEELRIWLLKNKQTNRWESTKATSEAVYALLLFGDNWLDNNKPVVVSMGDKPLKVAEYEVGTGYFKQSWNGAEVKNSWGDIKVENPNSNIVWGAAYWQYFEDLDKIKDFKQTPLTINKQLFTEENSATGPVLKPVTEGQTLKRGDKIKVRIEIRVDRAMEFVHLKDMRAAGFEPVNVLSGYRWQGGLGYYESTKDLATHFFIDYLPRGTYVFEYPLVVSLRGDMSNGITTMQCMYAPEFTSHSKGLRVKVE